MSEFERLTELVALYRKALVDITEQEELEDINGNRVPSTEMAIAQEALEQGKKLEQK